MIVAVSSGTTPKTARRLRSMRLIVREDTNTCINCGASPVLRPTSTSAGSRVERLIAKREGRVLEDPRTVENLP